MRMFLVVGGLPGPDFPPGIVDRCKPMGIEALLPQAGIKRLDMGVVRRGGRPRKDELDVVPVGPLIQRHRGKFRSIIDANFVGRRSPAGQAGQEIGDLDAPEVGAHADV